MNLANVEYYKYLEELRKSGITNMFGAGDYLMKYFSLDRKQSSEILAEWMSNYNEIIEYLNNKKQK